MMCLLQTASLLPGLAEVGGWPSRYWSGPRASNLGLHQHPGPSVVGRVWSTSKFDDPKGKSLSLKQQGSAGHPLGWSGSRHGPVRPHVAPGHPGQESVLGEKIHTGGNGRISLKISEQHCTLGFIPLDESRSWQTGTRFTGCVYHHDLIFMP